MTNHQRGNRIAHQFLRRSLQTSWEISRLHREAEEKQEDQTGEIRQSNGDGAPKLQICVAFVMVEPVLNCLQLQVWRCFLKLHRTCQCDGAPLEHSVCWICPSTPRLSGLQLRPQIAGNLGRDVQFQPQIAGNLGRDVQPAPKSQAIPEQEPNFWLVAADSNRSGPQPAAI